MAPGRSPATFAAETGSIPVVLEQDEKYQDDYRNRIFAELTAGKGPELGMPDGTTWLEEYLDFPENCEPERRIPRQISSSIFEEVKSYFEGDKNAGDTVKIIHNRVQFYLDENSQVMRPVSPETAGKRTPKLRILAIWGIWVFQ